jgi:hypothetical protein
MGLTIVNDHADGTLCEQPDRCFKVRLTDAELGCNDSVAGQWCLTWLTLAPSKAEAAPLIQQLAAAAVWQRTSVPLPAAPEPRSALADTPSASPAENPRWTGTIAREAAVNATCLFFAPAIFGGLLRLATRRRVKARRLIVGQLALTGFMIAVWPVEIWNILQIAFSIIAGTSLSLRKSLFVFSLPILAAGLVAIEAVARHGPEPRRYDPPSLLPPENMREATCAAIIDRDALESPGSSAATRVFHLGDSMVGSTGVSTHETFTALLGSTDPLINHVNWSIGGGSTDGELLALQSRLDLIRAHDILVLYYYTGNDFEGLDRTWSCSCGGPLLRYENTGVASRCETKLIRFTSAMLLNDAPRPYVLQAAARFSWAASDLLQLFDVRPASLPEGVAWSHLSSILQAMRESLAARHASFVVCVLPSRSLLSAPAPEKEREMDIRRHVIELAREAGAPVLDPWTVLRARVEREGIQALVLPSDIHFNAEGHRLMAGWLREQLAPMLKRERPSSGDLQAKLPIQ